MYSSRSGVRIRMCVSFCVCLRVREASSTDRICAVVASWRFVTGRWQWWARTTASERRSASQAGRSRRAGSRRTETGTRPCRSGSPAVRPVPWRWALWYPIWSPGTGICQSDDLKQTNKKTTSILILFKKKNTSACMCRERNEGFNLTNPYTVYLVLTVYCMNYYIYIFKKMYGFSLLEVVKVLGG